jgi:hypothetical protein
MAKTGRRLKQKSGRFRQTARKMQLDGASTQRTGGTGGWGGAGGWTARSMAAT